MCQGFALLVLFILIVYALLATLPLHYCFRSSHTGLLYVLLMLFAIITAAVAVKVMAPSKLILKEWCSSPRGLCSSHPCSFRTLYPTGQGGIMLFAILFGTMARTFALGLFRYACLSCR